MLINHNLPANSAKRQSNISNARKKKSIEKPCRFDGLTSPDNSDKIILLKYNMDKLKCIRKGV